MTGRSLVLVMCGAAMLSGCSVPIGPIAAIGPVPAQDPLYTPDRVTPGRLDYAPDRSVFPPVLTERAAFPTQVEANDAYRRSMAGASANPAAPVSVWLFGCKPGALDALTARVIRFRGPMVHCATDFLDVSGRRLRRQTANFFYMGSVWTMQPVSPPRTTVPWQGREPSAKDPWSWVPGRDRYE